jgi:cytochrome P450 family 110
MTAPFLQAIAMARGPDRFFEARRDREGDPFVINLPQVGAVHVTGHPEGARQIFEAPPETFEPVRANPVEPLLGRHSLILQDDAEHRRSRKLLAPPFRGERMRAYGELLCARTVDEAGRLVPGTSFVAQELARRVTLDVIVRCVFGIREPARRELFERAIGALLARYTAPLLVLPLLRREAYGVGPWARFVRARSAFRALLEEEIRQRRTEPQPGEDILSVLLTLRHDDGQALDDEAIVDQLCTLLVAGHETTATGLVWALYYLHRDARVLAALMSELERLGPEPAAPALADAPYLGAVCQEALRIHPVVPVVVRRLAGPLELRGRHLEAGENVMLALTLLHAQPAAWPEPEQFRPERFLERRFGPFEYAPFGGGVRRCLGAAFAAYEMPLVLGSLLARRRLKLARTHDVRPTLHNITMGPAKPIALDVVD